MSLQNVVGHRWQTRWAVHFERDCPTRRSSTENQIRTGSVIRMKVRHKGYLEISGFDCREFSFEGCGFRAAHNTWSEIDEMSAIINDHGSRRTGRSGSGIGVPVGMEASGHTRWFERLLRDPQFESRAIALRVSDESQ